MGPTRACGIQRNGLLCSTASYNSPGIVTMRVLTIIRPYASGVIQDAVHGFRRMRLPALGE